MALSVRGHNGSMVRWVVKKIVAKFCGNNFGNAVGRVKRRHVTTCSVFVSGGQNENQWSTSTIGIST
jgi:hypothetical protein